MSTQSNCPCEVVAHPVAPRNLPNQSSLEYRAGDFRSFRLALLRSRDGETALSLWRPSAEDDLLLQMAEWWAYIADVLTFYNERGINESFIGTAVQEESVRNLIRLLGYRPRPGIAATATVAALLSEKKPVTLPAGFQIQSKPGPGKEPQIFETEAAVTLSYPDAVPASPPESMVAADGTLSLSGTVEDIRPGDVLLLRPASWSGSVSQCNVLTVSEAVAAKDAAGTPYTQLRFTAAPTVGVSASASAYRLMRSRQKVGVWPYTTSYNLTASPADLEGVIRAIQPNDPAVFTAPGLPNTLVLVTSTTEDVWYTNSPDTTDPWEAPTSPTVPIGIPHTRMYYTPSLSGNWEGSKSAVRILIDWQDAGKLRNAPLASYSGTPATLVALNGASFRTGNSLGVLIEDAEGAGVEATASVTSSTPGQMTVASFTTTPPAMTTPLRVLHNVFDVSRGQSVSAEILGSGDAAVAAQSFKLKKSPLTYYASGDSFKSSLRVYVNGVQWTEAESFYDQPPDAKVFVTREDNEQKTHVQFGDGINGARLPSGTNNVVAYYRYGSGADAPEAGSLTVIANPLPGLKSLRNPVGAGGGSDPDPADRIRQYAPRSVLTFGRAIASDDYAVVAALAPGVARVQSLFAWNADEQRATVKLYVGDDAAAVESARSALAQVADPNRKFTVHAAIPIPTLLAVVIRISPDRIPADVVAAVQAELADPDTGLMGINVIEIGQIVYFSQIAEACLRVPGVTAAPGALFLDLRNGVVQLGLPPRIVPNEGEFFQLSMQGVFIFPVVTA